MECIKCGKIDQMERRTYQQPYVAYEEIKGVRLDPHTCRWVLDVEEILNAVDAEVTYQCSYCGHEYTEAEVMDTYIKEGPWK